jgi:heme/copper-type cytochrome/quinol oxidase subunit 1
MMFIVFGIIGGMIGLILSMIIRIELTQGGSQILGGDHELFNTVVTAHGLIMVFFMLMPILIGGYGNYFIPIMIGARDMAYPRMNNISF